jgi:hypothetical protein
MIRGSGASLSSTLRDTREETRTRGVASEAMTVPTLRPTNSANRSDRPESTSLLSPIRVSAAWDPSHH